MRDGFYLYAGYAGTQALGLMVDGTARIENLVQYIAGFIIVLGIGYVIYRKRSVWTQKNNFGYMFIGQFIAQIGEV